MQPRVRDGHMSGRPQGAPVVVHRKGLAVRLYSAMNAMTLVTISSGEVKTPRLRRRRAGIEKNGSINRPSGAVSSIASDFLGNLQAMEVALDAGDDPGVAGHLGVPPPVLSVLSEGGDIGEFGTRVGGQTLAW